MFDLNVPSALKHEQIWFGSIIGRPIDEESRMIPVSPTGRSMEIEAAEHIVPSPTLRPVERIEIYNQQYWWRILNSLHDTFPLVTRLFGYTDFNLSIAIPYLCKYVPRHWSLHLVGDRLEKWVREEYEASDKHLVLNAVILDWAFTESFFAPALPRLLPDQLPRGGVEALADKQFYLQPAIHLFSHPYDMFGYREFFLKQPPEYWVEHDFPRLEQSRDYHYILYRNKKEDISWLEISLPELHVLSRFKQGATIDVLCDWLEEQDQETCESAMENLHHWFQEWIHRGWLSLGVQNLPKKPWESILGK